jgi:hypothetical protein
MIKLGTQLSRGSNLKWHLFYDFNSTTNYFIEGSNAKYKKSLIVFE